MPQQFAFPKTAMPALGKGRMVGDWVRHVEATEPAVCQVQMHFIAQTAFRPDAKTIADQQHPDQQFGVDGWATCVAVKGHEILANVLQIDEPVNRAYQMVLRDMILQRELIKQRCLCFLLRPHHRKTPNP